MDKVAQEQPAGDYERRALDDGKLPLKGRAMYSRDRAIYRKQEFQRHQLPDVSRRA